MELTEKEYLKWQIETNFNEMIAMLHTYQLDCLDAVDHCLQTAFPINERRDKHIDKNKSSK